MPSSDDADTGVMVYEVIAEVQYQARVQVHVRGDADYHKIVSAGARKMADELAEWIEDGPQLPGPHEPEIRVSRAWAMVTNMGDGSRVRR